MVTDETPVADAPRGGVKQVTDRQGRLMWRANVEERGIHAQCSFKPAECGGTQAALAQALAWRERTLQLIRQLPQYAAASGERIPLASLLPKQPMLSMRAACRAVGVTCLDDEWHGIEHRYSFRCDHGHEWQRSGKHYYERSHCPVCANAEGHRSLRKDSNLRKMRELAHQRGGKCLSDEYRGTAARYRFRCGAGHEWEAHGASMLGGGWCRLCQFESMKGKRPCPEAYAKLPPKPVKANGLAELQQKSQAHGGECLSPAYLGVKLRHRFRCAQGHEWETPAMNVMQGKWCTPCSHASRRLTIEAAHQAAAANAGKCLSTQYENTRTHLSWECARGHRWQATLASVRSRGSWCRQCAHLNMTTHPKKKARARYEDGAKRLMADVDKSTVPLSQQHGRGPTDRGG